MVHTNEERYLWLRKALFASAQDGDDSMLDMLIELNPDSPSSLEAFDAAIDKAIDHGNS